MRAAGYTEDTSRGGDEPDTALGKPRVLLAEDDECMRLLLANMLRREGLEVIEASSGVELSEKLETLRRAGDGRVVDLIISDIRMPSVSGLSVLARLRSYDWATPVILITAFGDEATHDEARRLGATAVFDKPFDLHDLRRSALELVGAS